MLAIRCIPVRIKLRPSWRDHREMVRIDCVKYSRGGSAICGHLFWTPVFCEPQCATHALREKGRTPASKAGAHPFRNYLIPGTLRKPVFTPPTGTSTPAVKASRGERLRGFHGRQSTRHVVRVRFDRKAGSNGRRHWGLRGLNGCFRLSLRRLVVAIDLRRAAPPTVLGCRTCETQ